MENVKRVRIEEEVGESISTVPSQFVGGSSGQDSTGQHQHKQSNSTVPSAAPVFSHGQGGERRVRTWGGVVRNRGRTNGFKVRRNQHKKNYHDPR